MRNRYWAGWAMMGYLAALPASASAFRTLSETTTTSTQPIAWSTRDVTVELSRSGLSESELTVLMAELERAAGRWSAVACADIRFQFARVDGPGRSGDGRSTVTWVRNGWEARAFEVDAAATTDVEVREIAESAWVISEADVYLNGSLAWDGFAGSEDGVSLASALTHELGHLIGLEHPCERAGADGAPACEAALATYMTSALYPIHRDGGAALSEDDIAGVCHLYPLSACVAMSCASGQVCAEGGCVPVTELAGCRDYGCACETATHCREGACREGVCTRQVPIGEACAHDGECVDSDCMDGQCAAACEGVCDGGLECSAHGYCRALSLARGTCEVAADCTTYLCLRAGEEVRSCTSRCTTSDECLYGEACRTVGGSSVCVPVPPPSGGCSVRAHGAREGPGASGRSSWLVLFISVLGLVHQRRRGRCSRGIGRTA